MICLSKKIGRNGASQTRREYNSEIATPRPGCLETGTGLSSSCGHFEKGAALPEVGKENDARYDLLARPRRPFVPFRIIKPEAAPRRALEPGRGYSLRLVDTGIGVESLDLHLNVLAPGGPRGRLHRHTRSDNVYIVKSGEGLLTIENENHVIVADDVVLIPAGTRHALSNVSGSELVIYEIYAPAGAAFDFVAEA
jgi:mannose-6-phosphate isomerase-like protein (cupin superfamily)